MANSTAVPSEAQPVLVSPSSHQPVPSTSQPVHDLSSQGQPPESSELHPSPDLRPVSPVGPVSHQSSQTHPSAQTQPPPPPNDPQALLKALLSKTRVDCDKLVDDFRSAKLSKHQALCNIQLILLKANKNVFDGRCQAAVGAYLRTLDNYERFRDEAAQRPNIARVVDTAGEGPATIGEGGRKDEALGGTLGNVRDRSSVSSNKRRRELDEDEEEGSEDDSPPRKRIDTRLFPWLNGEADPVRPEIRETLAHLENFSLDIKRARNSLSVHTRKPQFPDSEWTKLLTGQVACLDHVFSAVGASALPELNRERFGSIEVVTGSSAPSKTVTSHSDWTIAWDSYVEAALTIFPHRAAEFALYGKTIKQLFSVIPSDRHLRVIQYDKAVRLRVSQRRDLLLSDISEFMDLQISWLQFGGNRGDGGKVTRQYGGQSNDPCVRWNKGVCERSPSVCRYQHVCSECRKRGHTAAKCPGL